eukprot:TRINITY_DN44182_c0_g1_i2.p1 TRINITY_DN44182_c0_g1~~TRINITY_DN44182_c0_g1_i2.p1  ORF type:complete len:117 (+),score=22.31 TRINITY_DN44182_c0_g1_i2:68-418(+)
MCIRDSDSTLLRNTRKLKITNTTTQFNCSCSYVISSALTYPAPHYMTVTQNSLPCEVHGVGCEQAGVDICNQDLCGDNSTDLAMYSIDAGSGALTMTLASEGFAKTYSPGCAPAGY